VKKALLEEKEKARAVKDAQLFAVDAFKKISEPGKSKTALFKEAADAKKLTVHQTEWLSAGDQKLKGLGNEPDLADAVLAIQPQIAISNAVKGNRAAFVPLLTEREEAREAKLDEVKDKVTADLKKSKAVNTAREKARETALAISGAPDQAAKVKEPAIAAKLGETKKFAKIFPPSGDNGRLIAKLSADTAPGKISAAENTDDGALFVFVEKKELPNPKEFDSQKNFFESVYNRQKQNAAMEMFADWLDSQTQYYWADKDRPGKKRP
jgi:hypothetical protein